MKRAELTVPVTFAIEAPSGADVAVLGDLPTWRFQHPLEEQEPGTYRLTLDLPPGVYRYKFRVNKDYVVPEGTLQDHAEGYANAVQVVGGAAGPLIHVPDRAHVVRSRGALRLHAEMCEGAEPPSGVWCRLADGELLRGEVEIGAPYGGRQPVVATVAVPDSATGQYGFAGYPEAVFSLPPVRAPGADLPAWLDGSVFYGIFVDRWYRAAPSEAGIAERNARSTAVTRYGGDLDGVAMALGELASLGVDAIVLTPVQPSPTVHRYDGLDLHAVDPQLGGEGALKRLVERCHDQGLKVVVDLSVTHVNVGHPAFQDVLKNQEQSSFKGWFQGLKFPVEPFVFGRYSWFYDRSDLVRLDLSPGRPAREHALEAARRLVAFGVDGLRLDAMDDAPADFWVELRGETRALNPNLLLLGEIVSDRPTRLAGEEGVDAATDFVHWKAFQSFVARDEIDAAAFVARVKLHEHRAGPLGHPFFLRFLDNHDTSRFLTIAARHDVWRSALSWLYFQPGPIWLSYGSEYDLASFEPSRDELDDAWFDRLPMPAPTSGGRTRRLIESLSGARQNVEGPLRVTSAEGRVLVCSRDLRAGGTMRFVLNASDAWLPSPQGKVVSDSSDEPLQSEQIPPRSARWIVEYAE